MLVRDKTMVFIEEIYNNRNCCLLLCFCFILTVVYTLLLKDDRYTLHGQGRNEVFSLEPDKVVKIKVSTKDL